ncbi:unnamed protein product [Protopolystoma xenopodis]|uniref:Uncharacterized protein n=1 Tax=Protopolystoma xenopodis TaxID=117903 RepID=A0A3S5BGD0_9PLAT|nr:unnamed protein product [Protopolystoma xenopodis]
MKDVIQHKQLHSRISPDSELSEIINLRTKRYPLTVTLPWIRSTGRPNHDAIWLAESTHPRVGNPPPSALNIERSLSIDALSRVLSWPKSQSCASQFIQSIMPLNSLHPDVLPTPLRPTYQQVPMQKSGINSVGSRSEKAISSSTTVSTAPSSEVSTSGAPKANLQSNLTLRGNKDSLISSVRSHSLRAHKTRQGVKANHTTLPEQSLRLMNTDVSERKLVPPIKSFPSIAISRKAQETAAPVTTLPNTQSDFLNRQGIMTSSSLDQTNKIGKPLKRVIIVSNKHIGEQSEKSEGPPTFSQLTRVKVSQTDDKGANLNANYFLDNHSSSTPIGESHPCNFRVKSRTVAKHLVNSINRSTGNSLVSTNPRMVGVLSSYGQVNRHSIPLPSFSLIPKNALTISNQDHRRSDDCNIYSYGSDVKQMESRNSSNLAYRSTSHRPNINNKEGECPPEVIEQNADHLDFLFSNANYLEDYKGLMQF